MTLDCPNVSLKKGASNSQVTELQTMLQKLGYYTGKIDGYYGSVTYNAVKKFQKATGHSQDGYFGPKTCPSLIEKYNQKVQATATSSNTSNTSNTSQKKEVFHLDPHLPIDAILKIFNEVVTLPDAVDKTNSNNLHSFTITRFLDLNSNRDAGGLTHEATVTLVYTEERRKIRKFQKAELTYRNGSNNMDNLTLKGYINNTKISHENDLWKIELSLVGYTEFLNKETEDYNETCKSSEHLKKLIALCGLKDDIDMTGLTDSVCTISAQKESSEDSDSETSSSSSGSGATMTLEEIYQKAATFKYGGIGTGLNPEKAWKAYENGGRTFDCYDCSNFLFYCLKNFAKIPCRIVQGYSPYSRSGTHRVVQIKENGSWHCPKQAWNLTKNLRPFTPEDKYTLTTKLSWEG